MKSEFYFKNNMEVNSDDDKNVSKSKSNEERMKIWPQVSVVNMLISLKRCRTKKCVIAFRFWAL